MTLQSSGPISFQQINVELGRTPTATISLNDAAVRKLLEKPSGIISMQDAYGKSDVIRFVSTISRTGVNIYQLMGSPTAVADYVFENNANIEATTAYYSLRTGVFPAGSTLTIVNNGYIYGRGGRGSSAVNTPGEAGGDAIILDMACRIDNTNGYILAGGGGGGSAERKITNGPRYYIVAGGGGGAGASAGAAGVNTLRVYSGATASDVTPQQGTTTAGGAGGIAKTVFSDINEIAYGGAGGTNGSSGAIGATESSPNPYKDAQTLGVAGAAGRAIITNGQALTQVAGFDSTRVKGAIV